MLEKIAQVLKISSNLNAIFWSIYLHAEFNELPTLKYERKGYWKRISFCYQVLHCINIPKMQVLF